KVCGIGETVAHLSTFHGRPDAPPMLPHDEISDPSKAKLARLIFSFGSHFVLGEPDPLANLVQQRSEVPGSRFDVSTQIRLVLHNLMLGRYRFGGKTRCYRESTICDRFRFDKGGGPANAPADLCAGRLQKFGTVDPEPKAIHYCSECSDAGRNPI